MAQHYDDMGINANILLDLPFREGIGVITQDVAKPRNPIIMENTPTWGALDNGLNIITTNGTNEYLWQWGADCPDLNVTGDYSIAVWVKRAIGGDSSQIVIGRYSLDNAGWELYFYSTGTLTLRHHHAAGATVRTGIYSSNWLYSTWCLIGISRSGASAIHTRNGEELDTSVSPGGLIDPEAMLAAPLVIATRSSMDTHHFKGSMWRPRFWERALTVKDFKAMYEIEKGWFA